MYTLAFQSWLQAGLDPHPTLFLEIKSLTVFNMLLVAYFVFYIIILHTCKVIVSFLLLFFWTHSTVFQPMAKSYPTEEDIKNKIISAFWKTSWSYHYILEVLKEELSKGQIKVCLRFYTDYVSN